MSEDNLLLLINFLVVPLLVELYKLIVNHFDYKPSKFHVSIVLSVVAVALSYVFGEDFFAALPPFDEGFLDFLVALIDGVGKLFGAAVLVYNVIYEKFFDAIGKRLNLFAYRLKR